MHRSFATGPEIEARSRDRAARLGVAPLVALLLAGLLRDVATHDEAYAGVDYALSLLALLGAAGCVAGFAYRLSLGVDPLPWARPATPGLPAPAVLAITSERGAVWPLLVALLFGPFVVLLAGLGGWV